MGIFVNQNRRYNLPNALLLAVIVVCALVIGVQRNIHRELLCHAVSADGSGYNGQVTVTFDGRYLDFLLRTDSFDGTINVSPAPWLPEGTLWLPDVPREQLDPWELPVTTRYTDMGTIGYFIINDGNVDSVIRGTLWAEEDLESFIIEYMIPVDTDTGTHLTTAGYITYPEALTQEEARARIFGDDAP